MRARALTHAPSAAETGVRPRSSSWRVRVIMSHPMPLPRWDAEGHSTAFEKWHWGSFLYSFPCPFQGMGSFPPALRAASQPSDKQREGHANILKSCEHKTPRTRRITHTWVGKHGRQGSYATSSNAANRMCPKVRPGEQPPGHGSAALLCSTPCPSMIASRKGARGAIQHGKRKEMGTAHARPPRDEVAVHVRVGGSCVRKLDEGGAGSEALQEERGESRTHARTHAWHSAPARDAARY